MTKTRLMTLNSTDKKLVVWIGGLELVARPFFCVFLFLIFHNFK